MARLAATCATSALDNTSLAGPLGGEVGDLREGGREGGRGSGREGGRERGREGVRCKGQVSERGR